MQPLSAVDAVDSAFPGPLVPAEDAPLVSVVIPGLNEGPALPELARRVDAALAPLGRYELIFVDDGSTDDSWQRIVALHGGTLQMRAATADQPFAISLRLPML